MSVTRAQIEQAIAYGRSFDWILTHLDATTRDLDDALRHMDEAVADDPWVQRRRLIHAGVNRWTANLLAENIADHRVRIAQSVAGKTTRRIASNDRGNTDAA